MPWHVSRSDQCPADLPVANSPLWQDRSAPPEIDDPLNEAIKEILAQIDE